MTGLRPLPYETPCSAADLDVMRTQLGRAMRGVHSVARRCACGRPAVVRTLPVLPGGAPFPTSFYLTLPSATRAASRLEATGIMAAWSRELEVDAELADRYRAAHSDYLARRAELGHDERIDTVSAGGMPARVKCLHALLAHALAAGPGVNPLGDRTMSVLADADPAWSIDVCECETA